MTVILDCAYLLGIAAVAVGAGLIYLPAGLIVGGALVASSAYRAQRGSPEVEQ